MSCSSAMMPGETCSSGWHLQTLPAHACFVPAYRIGNCFKGNCRKTGERCAYEGQQLAIQRCPAYAAAVERNINNW